MPSNFERLILNPADLLWSLTTDDKGICTQLLLQFEQELTKCGVTTDERVHKLEEALCIAFDSVRKRKAHNESGQRSVAELRSELLGRILGIAAHSPTSLVRDHIINQPDFVQELDARQKENICKLVVICLQDNNGKPQNDRALKAAQILAHTLPQFMILSRGAVVPQQIKGIGKQVAIIGEVAAATRKSPETFQVILGYLVETGAVKDPNVYIQAALSETEGVLSVPHTKILYECFAKGPKTEQSIALANIIHTQKLTENQKQLFNRFLDGLKLEGQEEPLDSDSHDRVAHNMGQGIIDSNTLTRIQLLEKIYHPLLKFRLIDAKKLSAARRNILGGMTWMIDLKTRAKAKDDFKRGWKQTTTRVPSVRKIFGPIGTAKRFLGLRQ